MSSVINVPVSYFSENNIRYVFMDGNACKYIDGCYRVLQQQLSIPEYFGKNLDALEEVLADLDWIEEKRIKIIILNSDGLLAGDMAKKEAFLAVLNSNENKKLEILYLGKAADH